jgi:hypothetical protein
MQQPWGRKGERSTHREPSASRQSPAARSRPLSGTTAFRYANPVKSFQPFVKISDRVVFLDAGFNKQQRWQEEHQASIDRRLIPYAGIQDACFLLEPLAPYCEDHVFDLGTLQRVRWIAPVSGLQPIFRGEVTLIRREFASALRARCRKKHTEGNHHESDNHL